MKPTQLTGIIVVVALLAVVFNHSRRTCGGTIISPKWVITAAHCMEKRRWNKNLQFVYKLIAGDHNFNLQDEHEQTRFAVRIVDGPGYDHVTLAGDISLIEVGDPFVLDEYVVPALLPRTNESPRPFTNCMVAGWGYDTPYSRPEVLQTLVMPNYPQKICELIHHPTGSTQSRFNNKMMCAGYLKGTRDTCRGDSGGPLTCPRSDGDDWKTYHVITGIVSWGRSCGTEGSLPVFTKVESYLKWIHSVLDQQETVNHEPCQLHGVTYHDRSSDTIRTPNYKSSGLYPPSAKCNWRYDMSAYHPKRIFVDVRSFELEKRLNGKCSSDYLKIFTGKFYTKLYGTYCGASMKSQVIELDGGEDSHVKFEFSSDFSIIKKGFVISVSTQ